MDTLNLDLELNSVEVTNSLTVGTSGSERSI